MIYLSWDCAHKTLAYVIVEILDVGTLLESIRIISYGLIDVIPSIKLEDSTPLMRALGVKYAVNNVITISREKNIIIDKILIEYQTIQNDKSREVSHQLLYHYCDSSIDTIIIGPSLKNTIALGDAEQCSYRYWIGRCLRNYDANKKHTKYNLEYYLEYIKNNCNDKDYLDSLRRLVLLKKKDDVADAFMQAIAYHVTAIDTSKLAKLASSDNTVNTVSSNTNGL